MLPVQIDRNRFALPKSHYFETITKKDLIVLHFTAGRTAVSAFDSWRKTGGRIATSYVVDVDGAVYELFDPRAWAYHLGIKGASGRHDRRSIGIEIANVGPLKPSPEDPAVLNWWPREWTTRFCSIDENEKYVRRPYRGIEYFAAFPEKQAESTASLVHDLCERFEIPRLLPDKSRRTECDMPFFSKHKGIATHSNFRPDKWDIGPAFNWDILGF
jgi:N-acetyl-anhydromuramyl-L-alanine amidase AmpD